MFNTTWKLIPLLTKVTTLILNTRFNFITDYVDFRDYSTYKIIPPVTTLITLIFTNTWGIHLQDCVVKNDDHWLRWRQWFTQDYIKNNFIIDYADCTDYQDHLENCFIMTIFINCFSLTTLIYWVLWLRWLRWYSTLHKK